ncbi:unnamed protein product [Parnassius apollo]|nr:unnamed protein product [Parnassius apollo]CAG4986789.1 unnamed protein product [Parnassius apollo]CAG4986792.1 unnamed protein product [Parnassius apollo]
MIILLSIMVMINHVQGEDITVSDITINDLDVTTGILFEKTQSFYVYTDFLYIPIEIDIHMEYDDISREIALFNITDHSIYSVELIDQLKNFTLLKRTKRSWPSEGLLPFIGEINSKFTGVATLRDIENLKVQSQSLTEYVNGLKEIMKTQLNLNEQLITDVKQIQIDLTPIKSTIVNVVNELGSYQEKIDSTFREIKRMLTYQRLKMALETRHLTYELFQMQLVQTIDKCNLHYLSESLINKGRLINLLEEVHPNLKNMKLNPAIGESSIEMYYSLPLTNCLREKDTFFVLLNIPIIPDSSNQIIIYKVRPIPMLINNKKYIINTDNTELMSSILHHSYKIDLSTVLFSPYCVDQKVSGIIQSNGLQVIDQESCLSQLLNGAPLSELKMKCSLVELGRNEMP